MCMCRSTSISRREASAGADAGRCRRVVPARDEPGVDLPRARRPRATSENLARSWSAWAAAALAQRRARRSAGEVAGERLHVAGLELEPALALAEQLLVGRQPRGDRASTPPASARTSIPGDGRTPSEASTRMSAPASASASDISLARRRTRPARAAAGRASPAPPAAAATRPSRARRRRRGASAARAGTVRSAARSSPALNSSCTGSCAVVLRSRRRRPGGSPGSRRGSSAASGPGWRRSSRSRASSRAEQQPRQRTRAAASRGSARSGAWKLPTFSAARVAQRDARGARRERLVDVDEVERSVDERLLDRPGDVDRQRGARRRRAGENGSTSPTPSTSGSPSARSSSASALAADRPAAVAHELGRLRRAR